MITGHATIETARLRLTPYAPAHLLALADGDREFETSFGLPAAPGVRGFMVSGEVSPEWRARLQAASSADPWLYGFAVVDRESASVIGILGFKGAPDDDGTVEIAYGIAPEFEGQGYATEAAAAGVAFAFANDQVRMVRAHTLPVRNASTRILTKCGFERIGEIEDPEDGLVWRWELRKLQD